MKFILSITSIFFDSIFFFQFWLYRNNKGKKKVPDLDEFEEGKGILDEFEGVKGIADSKQVSSRAMSGD